MLAGKAGTRAHGTGSEGWCVQGRLVLSGKADAGSRRADGKAALSAGKAGMCERLMRTGKAGFRQGLLVPGRGCWS